VHEFSEFVGCQDKGETGVTHTFLPWESQIWSIPLMLVFFFGIEKHLKPGWTRSRLSF
jgi:hypothetical protein